MKICHRCTSPIEDDAMFCPICGQKQEMERKVTNMFCTRCGEALVPNTQYCGRCGMPNMVAQTQAIFQYNIPVIIGQLSNRIVLVSVLWICIASLQLICALLTGYCFLVFSDFEYFISMLIYGILGIVNMISSIGDLKYQNKIKMNFVGIFRKMKVTGGVLAMYIYNSYVVWVSLTSEGWLTMLIGIILLAVLIIDGIVVRFFVHTNEEAFLRLERSQTNNPL